MASGGSFSRSANSAWPSPPPAQGLYDPKREHDACGVGFVADLKGGKPQDRRARPPDPGEPHPSRRRRAPTRWPATAPASWCRSRMNSLQGGTAPLRIKLPEPGHYAVGHMFMPRNRAQRIYCESVVERVVEAEGPEAARLARRAVGQFLPVGVGDRRPSRCTARCSSAAGPTSSDEDDFERRLYILRKVISQHHQRRYRRPRHRLLHRVAVLPHAGLQGHVPRLPARRLLPRPASIRASPRRSRWCISASRPTPSRPGSSPTPIAWSPITARSTRCAATSTGWRRGRRRVSSPLFGADIEKLWPISYEGQSDTACFDNALEFLVQGGYSLAHAAMMLIPEAWAGNPLMDAKRRAFYEYHAALMEPWDGPAAMAFTDGRQIGATLDRNGLRPARYIVTDDGLVIMASESGVLPIAGGEASSRSGGSSPARCCSSTWRRAASSPTRRSRPSSPPRIPISNGSTAPRSACMSCRGARRARAAHQCQPARSPAGVRLHAGRASSS